MPTDPVPSPMSSSTSVIYAFFHTLHSPVRGAPCHPSRDMPLLSSLPLSRQRSRREREPLMDFGADRPTAPLDGRPLPPYFPPLDTECDCTGCAWDDSRLKRTLWRRSASSNGPFCASTCGFVMVVCQGTPSWHLGANRHPKISMSRVPSCTTARPPQTMQLQFQKTALVPAFRELRVHDIYASTPKLAASQSCAHGDLSHRPTLPTYLFFHSQDRCIETPPLHRDAPAASRRPHRSSLVRRGLLHTEERSYKGFCRIPLRIKHSEIAPPPVFLPVGQLPSN